MKKTIFIFTVFLLFGCDIDFSQGALVVAISGNSLDGLCTYTLSRPDHDAPINREDVVDSCGKYQIGDILYLTKPK